MKPTDAQKKRISRWVDKWKRRLILNEWNILVRYQMHDLEPDGTFYVIGQMDDNHVYMKGTLKIFPQFWERTPATQEETIVHELCHCIASEYSQAMADAMAGNLFTPRQRSEMNERLVQRITNAVFYGGSK